MGFKGLNIVCALSISITKLSKFSHLLAWICAHFALSSIELKKCKFQHSTTLRVFINHSLNRDENNFLTRTKLDFSIYGCISHYDDGLSTERLRLN